MIYGNTCFRSLYFTLDTPTQSPEAIHTETSSLVCFSAFSQFGVKFWFGLLAWW